MGPVDLSQGRALFHLGKLSMNSQLAVYYNAVKPDYGRDWQC